MNIKQAKEAIKRHNQNSDDVKKSCGCFPHEPNTYCYKSFGFIEGYEAGVRDAITKVWESGITESLYAKGKLKEEILKLLDEVKK